jgi:hypothetical protein
MKTKSDDCFSEDRQGITYREGKAPLTSLLIGLFGLLFVALAIGVCFEVAGWPWHGGKVMGLITALAFASFGGAAALLAIAGVQPQRLQFHQGTRRVQGRMRGGLWLLKSIDASFDDLQHPVISASSREMNGDLYEVRVAWNGHPTLALGSFDERADTEHWQKRLTSLLEK